MSNASDSLLSLLPGPAAAAPSDSFNDRVIQLLAAAATSDGLLTYREYRQTQEAAVAIFGERAFHAALQAKLHYALLHPPIAPGRIAQELARQAEEQEVSASFIQSMLEALRCIGKTGEGERRLSDELELAFHPEREPYLLEQLGQAVGHTLGAGVSGSIGGLKKMSRWLTPGRRSDLTPVTETFNAEMEQMASAIDRIGWTLEDAELREAVRTFRKLLQDQPFKVVIVGERKRGKSSLMNALVGERLSPVRESTPETAAVVAFRYAPSPEYKVHFLDSSQFARLEDYLKDERDNSLLRNKIETIRQGVQNGTFIPGKLIAGATSREELTDYISAEGRFANLVARVDIGLPVPLLRGGMTLVDTPGLNDTDRFHDYLSYEESLEADCVLFVMDARDPGSRSELELLRKLTLAGRSVCIIGVLTNIDRLNDAGSLAAAQEQARAVLQEACRTSAQVRLAGVIAINARKAANTDTASPELAQLLQLIRDAMAQDRGKTAYRSKVGEGCLRIVAQAQESLRRHIHVCHADLPDAALLSMLNSCASGVSVVNIDNGFGAGYLANMINHMEVKG